MEQIAAQKKALRNTLRQQRKQLDRDLLRRESAALCENLLKLPELKRAQTVFCYVSCGGEAETHRLIETLLAQGKRVTVPRVRAAMERYGRKDSESSQAERDDDSQGCDIQP